MLKIITPLAFFLIGIAANAQVSENRVTAPFSKIEVKNGVALIYTEEATTSIRVEVQNDNQLSEVITEFKNNVLKISQSNMKLGTVKVYITANNVSCLEASNGSQITLTNWLHAEKLNVVLHSKSTFSGTTITKEIQLTANDESLYNGRSESDNFFGVFKNSKINVSGFAKMSYLKADENSYLFAKNYIADDITVYAKNESSVVMYAKNRIQLNTDESASLTYFESPEKVKLHNYLIASN